MATERLRMRDLREILRQKVVLKRSNRQVGASLRVSHGAVSGAVWSRARPRARLGEDRDAQRRRMATVLQAYHGMSDAEAVEMTVVDLRWPLMLDRLGANEPAFSQGALSESRARLIRHDMDRRLLERTVGVDLGLSGIDRQGATSAASPSPGPNRCMRNSDSPRDDSSACRSSSTRSSTSTGREVSFRLSTASSKKCRAAEAISATSAIAPRRQSCSTSRRAPASLLLPRRHASTASRADRCSTAVARNRDDSGPDSGSSFERHLRMAAVMLGMRTTPPWPRPRRGAQSVFPRTSNSNTGSELRAHDSTEGPGTTSRTRRRRAPPCAPRSQARASRPISRCPQEPVRRPTRRRDREPRNSSSRLGASLK